MWYQFSQEDCYMILGALACYRAAFESQRLSSPPVPAVQAQYLANIAHVDQLREYILDHGQVSRTGSLS